jgi:hypothetical protein
VGLPSAQRNDSRRVAALVGLSRPTAEFGWVNHSQSFRLTGVPEPAGPRTDPSEPSTRFRLSAHGQLECALCGSSGVATAGGGGVHPGGLALASCIVPGRRDRTPSAHQRQTAIWNSG